MWASLINLPFIVIHSVLLAGKFVSCVRIIVGFYCFLANDLPCPSNSKNMT